MLYFEYSPNSSVKIHYKLEKLVCLTFLFNYSVVAELDADAMNITDENGDTPLHIACSFGLVEVAKHLIKRGADIEAR